MLVFRKVLCTVLFIYYVRKIFRKTVISPPPPPAPPSASPTLNQGTRDSLLRRV